MHANLVNDGPFLVSSIVWFLIDQLQEFDLHSSSHRGALVMLTYITLSTFFHDSSLISAISVSRETIRSRKKSDYNLNKANAPILTNTTLNVIRLVGELYGLSCGCIKNRKKWLMCAHTLRELHCHPNGCICDLLKSHCNPNFYGVANVSLIILYLPYFFYSIYDFFPPTC